VWKATEAPFTRIVVAHNEEDAVFKNTPVSFNPIIYGPDVIVGFSAAGSSSAITVRAYVSRDLGDTWTMVTVGSARGSTYAGVTADGLFWYFASGSKTLWYSPDLVAWLSAPTTSSAVSFATGELLVINNTNELLVYKGGGMISLPPLTNFVDAVYPWQGGVLAFGLLDVGGMSAARLTDIVELTTAAFLPVDYAPNEYFSYNPSTGLFLGRYGSMVSFTPPFWTLLKQTQTIGYALPVEPVLERLFFDTFDGADNTELSDHVSDTGHQWVLSEPPSGAPFPSIIYVGRLYPQSTYSAANRAVYSVSGADSPTADFELSYGLGGTINGGAGVRLTARLQHTNGQYVEVEGYFYEGNTTMVARINDAQGSRTVELFTSTQTYYGSDAAIRIRASAEGFKVMYAYSDSNGTAEYEEIAYIPSSYSIEAGSFASTIKYEGYGFGPVGGTLCEWMELSAVVPG